MVRILATLLTFHMIFPTIYSYGLESCTNHPGFRTPGNQQLALPIMDTQTNM